MAVAVAAAQHFETLREQACSEWRAEFHQVAEEWDLSPMSPAAQLASHSAFVASSSSLACVDERESGGRRHGYRCSQSLVRRRKQPTASRSEMSREGRR